MARGKKHTPEQVVNLLRQIEGLCCKHEAWTDGVGYDDLPQTSSSLEFEAFTDESDCLRERTGTIPKARSTMRASPRMSWVRLKTAAWP